MTWEEEIPFPENTVVVVFNTKNTAPAIYTDCLWDIEDGILMLRTKGYVLIHPLISVKSVTITRREDVN